MPLIDKIQDKSAVIGVVGLGYVGLPLAIAFAEAGFEVKGYDTDSEKVSWLLKSYPLISDVDRKSFATLMSSSKRLHLTTDPPDSWKAST